MKTRLIALFALFALLLPIPAIAQAPTAGQVRSSANLRSGPGTNFSVVGHATAGTSVQIAECNSDCTWYQLSDGNWIAAFLVDATTVAAAAPSATPTVATAAVPSASSCPSATVAANIRSGPGTTYNVVGHATPGACIVIAARTDAGDWYQLSDGNWIFAELVSNAGNAVATPGAIATVAPATPTDVTRATVIPVETDTSTPAPTETPTPAPTATSTPTNTPVCDPNYAGACIPIVNGDLDCPQAGAVNFQVVGTDHYHFDRDHDGIACEQ